VIGKLLNAIGYQGVWIATVAGASRGLPWVGPLAAAMFAVGVLAGGDARRRDLRLAALAMAIGAVADSAWIALGWLDFSAAWPSAAFAPAWILGLWLSLALTLNHSLAFLKGRLPMAAAFGAIGGPFAYWAASKTGAVHLDAPPAIVFGGLGIAWAVVFPALVRFATLPAAAAAPLPSQRVHP
jgi:hypothetical protein